MQDTKGKVILSLLAGATAGIVAGLLLAPETGDETRSGLKKSASKFGGDLNKLLKDGLDRFSSAKATGPTADRQQADRSAADSLLNSIGQPSASPDEADSDYDGIGSDGRHFPGYTSHS
ncbi:YtxH domain-containing protein [Microvirga sp. STR05]|uniref:YtxH domain-containing protein n=1 Tax=Hymenobacter duratus TaxID=2771356 RepID=A0ABR8JII5_9BACT|nr:YtxH domain-containing protein [Hymenobacter duratus]MBD2715655.1 YtxH domain-containing protein [Hymenobacter duratus]MBR7950563.1 YtxH domain-containing protein [Microvirga sp. STR05]